MENQSSITSLMSAFSRAFHTENEACPVFSDTNYIQAVLKGNK